MLFRPRILIRTFGAVLACWLFVVNVGCFAEPEKNITEQISILESTVFGRTSNDLPLSKRLDQLDMTVFGTPQAASAVERVEMLKKFLLSNTKETPSESQVTPGPVPDANNQMHASTIEPNLPLLPLQPASHLSGRVSSENLTGGAQESGAKEFCGRWFGWLSGNDPRVRVSMELQCRNNQVTGSFLWSSPRSGTNKRAVSGDYDPRTLAVTLRDDDLLFAMPMPGWVFCPIDRYELKLSGNGQELSGRFWSAACRDHGTFRVQKVDSK